MKTALITGVSGFVGRHFHQYLSTHNWHVIGVDTRSSELCSPVPFEDALDLFTCSRKVYDLVIHAAAADPHRAAIDSVAANFPYNTLLDSALFEWAIRTQQRHIVYLSSCAVYPVHYQTGEHGEDWRLREEFVMLDQAMEPDSRYGWAKLSGERLAAATRECGVPVTVVRPFSGYGSDQSTNFPFGAFITRALARADPFEIWGDGTQVRDWIHIDDFVAGTLRLVEADAQSQHHAVNLCSGHGMTFHDLAYAVTEMVNYAPKFKYVSSAPRGVSHRIGDPTILNTYYEPRVTLAEGISRALRRNRD